MPTLQCGDYRVWFGTDDAPAPSGAIPHARELTARVGVLPDDPQLMVRIRYRRQGGAWMTLPTRALPKQGDETPRYYDGVFRDLAPGAVIEYTVQCQRAGRVLEASAMHTLKFELTSRASIAPRGMTARGRIAVGGPREVTPKPAATRGGRAAVENKPTPPTPPRAFKVARLAGLSNDVIARIADKTSDVPLLDHETAINLVAEGALAESDVGKLAVAAVAFDVTDGDEVAAGKVMAAFEGKGVTKPQDLAGMTREEMTTVLEHAGGEDRNVAAERAASLHVAMSKAFPSETLAPSRTPLPASNVGSEKQPVAVKPEVIARVWKNNAGLDLLRMDISKDSPDRKNLNLAGLASSERKAVIRDIQVRKGAVRATGNPAIAEKFLKSGITSPASVSPIDLAKESGISLAQAKNIHERDIKHYGRLSHGLFTLIDAHSGGLQNTAVGNLRRAKIVEFVRRSETNETFDGLDSIQELFGDLDSCNCKHCNSILGPAAYFVDLMHFAQTHVLDDDVAEGEAPFKGKQNHRLHLKTRRPDLWVLPLTCENTHTEIPQLQISSEIFENFIARKRGVAVKPDRAGVVPAVYGSILPSGRHSVLQPFHLPIEELEVYLAHFKLRRSDIARLLDEPEEDQLRVALGMSRIHAGLIAVPEASPVNIRNKLGITIPSDGILTVRQMLTATQVCRRDLGELVESKFVGGTLPLTIVPEKKSAESVQFDIERVHGVTLEHLDRIHRLLRLRKHLPWLPRELDGFIAATGGDLDSAVLADAGRAALLKMRFKASVQELCALGGALPEFPIERPKMPDDKERTPFDALFNVPDLTREDGSYPNPSIRFSLAETSSVQQERAMRLRAGLRIDEGELTTLIEGLAGAFEEGPPPNVANTLMRFFRLRLRTSQRANLPPSAAPKLVRPLVAIGDGTGSFPLSRRNLSMLYRHTVLARWLKLGITDLLTLVRLTPNVDHHVADLNDAIAVVHFYDWWKATPFSLEDLSLLLAPVEAVQDQVQDLWEALQAWQQEQDQSSFTDTFLTQVEGVSEELSRELVALNTGILFEADGDLFRIKAGARVADLELPSGQGTDVDLEAIRLLVRGYHPDERLPRALTESLQTNIELARAVVAVALSGENSPGPEAFLQAGPLPEALVPALVGMLRLHRVGAVLRLARASLMFFAGHQIEFGVSSWAEPNHDALRRLAATQAVLKKSFRDDPAPGLAQLEQVLADRNRLAAVATSLFGLDPALTRDAVTRLRIPENAIDALFKVQRYGETANMLSVDAAALANIVSEDYARASSASAAVMAGFRAKYPDESTWKEKAELYQERVLEKKRDALIDYLLRGPDAEFPDAREMYKYFLIDGEVDGCFRTSRVVAASSSLQLYVHRIRMNLEKEPSGGVHVKPSLIPDEEWEWRQHYRVWEANRKIFLWPENYLDPTIRDDKTPLFEELESELLQQEISEQTVVDAYSNYLKGLEELANLRYAGAYHHYSEDGDSGDITDILYFFGATGGDAPTHYWREIRNLARSQEDELVSPEHGPWRKVETRIPARHVSPVVYDGQLRVFWNEITTTSQNVVNEGKSRFIGYSIAMH